MTKDDIIRMAQDAAERHGHTFKEQPNDAVLETMAEAYAMGAAAARLQERKRCADIVTREAHQYSEPVWAVEIINDIEGGT